LRKILLRLFLVLTIPAWGGPGSASPVELRLGLYTGTPPAEVKGARPKIVVAYSIDFKLYSPSLVVHAVPKGDGAGEEVLNKAFKLLSTERLWECDATGKYSSRNEVTTTTCNVTLGEKEYFLMVVMPDPERNARLYRVRIFAEPAEFYKEVKGNVRGTVIPSHVVVDTEVELPADQQAVLAFFGARSERLFLTLTER
jgi:hypothetical protein